MAARGDVPRRKANRPASQSLPEIMLHLAILLGISLTPAHYLKNTAGRSRQMRVRLFAALLLLLAIVSPARAQNATDALMLADLQAFMNACDADYRARKTGGRPVQMPWFSADPITARRTFIAQNMFKAMETQANYKAATPTTIPRVPYVDTDMAYVDPDAVVAASQSISGWNAVVHQGQRQQLVREGSEAIWRALGMVRGRSGQIDQSGKAMVDAIVARAGTTPFGLARQGQPGFQRAASLAEFNDLVTRTVVTLEQRIQQQFNRPNYRIKGTSYMDVFAQVETAYNNQVAAHDHAVDPADFVDPQGAQAVRFQLQPNFVDSVGTTDQEERDRLRAIAVGEAGVDGR